MQGEVQEHGHMRSKAAHRRNCFANGVTLRVVKYAYVGSDVNNLDFQISNAI